MLGWRGVLVVVALVVAVRALAAMITAGDPQPASVVQPPPLVATEETAAKSAASIAPAGGNASDAPPAAASAAASPTAEPPDAFTPSEEFQEWITKLAREHLPHEYAKKKNWGHTAKTFDGVSVRMVDGQLKTHRKFKEANDGTWQMYRVKLKDPEEKFDVRIANIRALPGGHVGMDITAVASLEVFGRQTLWEHGVQLFSLAAEADARVRLWAHTEVAARLDPTRFPPDVYLDPEVKEARLDIPDFRLRRISELHGPLVRSLSHTVREALEDKLAEDNARLVVSLNRAITKQEKKLKLSLADLMKSKWSGLLGTGASGAKDGAPNPSPAQ